MNYFYSDLWHVTVASARLRDIVDVFEEFVEARHLWAHLLHRVGHTEDWDRQNNKTVKAFTPCLQEEEQTQTGDELMDTNWLSLWGSWC